LLGRGEGRGVNRGPCFLAFYWVNDFLLSRLGRGGGVSFGSSPTGRSRTGSGSVRDYTRIFFRVDRLITKRGTGPAEGRTVPPLFGPCLFFGLRGFLPSGGADGRPERPEQGRRSARGARQGSPPGGPDGWEAGGLTAAGRPKGAPQAV